MGVLSLDRLGRRLPSWCAAFAVAARFQDLPCEVGSLYIAVVGFRWVIFVYTVWIGGFQGLGGKLWPIEEITSWKRQWYDMCLLYLIHIYQLWRMEEVILWRTSW